MMAHKRCTQLPLSPPHRVGGVGSWASDGFVISSTPPPPFSSRVQVEVQVLLDHIHSALNFRSLVWVSEASAAEAPQRDSARRHGGRSVWCQGHVHLFKPAWHPLPHKDPTSRYRHGHLICLIWSSWIRLSCNTDRHITLISQFATGVLPACVCTPCLPMNPAFPFLNRIPRTEKKKKKKKLLFFFFFSLMCEKSN